MRTYQALFNDVAANAAAFHPDWNLGQVYDYAKSVCLDEYGEDDLTSETKLAEILNQPVNDEE